MRTFLTALEARAALFLQNVEQHRDKGQPIIKGGSKNYSATPKAAAFDFKTTARISLTVRRVFDGDLQRLTLDGTPISYPLSGQWWNKLDKPGMSYGSLLATAGFS
jgi:hypothetical protein